MSIGGYKIFDQQGVHFVTFATVEWVDVFSRQEYRDVLLDSLRYCQINKGLKLYAWCIMSNHVHLMVSSESGDLSGLLRDFKKHTSVTILNAIRENQFESRRNWMLAVFSKAGAENIRNSNFQFWRQDNHPIECYSHDFTKQKLNYIHDNPVAARIVDRAEDYLYSSARDYAGITGLLEIELLF